MHDLHFLPAGYIEKSIQSEYRYNILSGLEVNLSRITIDRFTTKLMYLIFRNSNISKFDGKCWWFLS